MRITGILSVSLMLFPRLAVAQSGSYQPSPTAIAAVQPASSPASLIAAPASEVDLLAARRFSSRAPGATLMIIGGAAIVAGLLTSGSGSTFLIIGGVGVGAYGAYLYFQ